MVGLALSGGGIRSATFSLGVLQALHRLGIFRHVDYLSTVSGGGYIGSALSSLITNAFHRRKTSAPPPGPTLPVEPADDDSEQDLFPFPASEGSTESVALTHLRNHSNYMFAGGAPDLFRMLAVLLRGIILNSLALFPFLLMMSLIVVLGYGQQLSDRGRFDDQVERIDGLLARYFGTAEGETMPEVEALLATLESEALLRRDQGRTRFDLIHELRPALALEPRERRGLLRRRPEADHELITGSGTQANPYRLSPQTSRKQIATALLVTDVLQRNEAIREIELLTRLVEKEGYRHCEECVGDLLKILRRRLLLRQPTSDAELLRFLAGRKSAGRTGPWATGVGEDPAEYRWRGSLKQTLQALYNGEYLDEATLRGVVASKLQSEAYYAYGWYAGRVGQLFPGSWYAEDVDGGYAGGLTGPYQGETISLSFENADLWDVLTAFAQYIGVDFVLSPGVRGTVTIRVNDLPWEQVLEMILAANDLWYEMDGATVRVIPEAQAIANLEVRPAARSKDPEPVQLKRTIELDRRRAEDEVDTLVRRLAASQPPFDPLDLRAILKRLSALAADGPPPLRPDPANDSPDPTSDSPVTTEDDVARLLRFEELSRIDDPFALQVGTPLSEVIELLYRGNYLNRDFVYGQLAAELSEAARLAESVAPEGFPPACTTNDHFELECVDPVGAFLALLEPRTTVLQSDLLRLLRSSGSVESCQSSELVTCIVEGDNVWAAGTTPSSVIEEVRDLLDDAWVESRAYVYDYGWNRKLLGRGYPGDWCASEAPDRVESSGCPAGNDESWRALARAVRDPSSWDPDHLTLPFTWILVRVGLGWVLLFPLILLLGGPLYRERRRAVTASSNPLKALLTSDESLVWRARYEKTFGALLFAIVLAFLIELLPYAVHHFHYLAVRGRSTQSLVVGGLSLVITLLSGPALAFLDRVGRRVTLVALSIAGPLLLLTIFVMTTEYVVYAPSGGLLDALLGWLPGDLTLWVAQDGRRFLDPFATGTLFALVALGSYILASLVDINATSLHGLYRDRLSRAFLVGLDTGGTIEPEEDLSLSQICPPDSGAPYHLLNGALNLQGSRDRRLRGRKSDPFFFSRNHVGGLRTGYCRTNELERLRPELHLGSAMAVSGAAVSPNMGRFTKSAVAVLISLVNARLALWVPNPKKVRSYFTDLEGALRRPHAWLGLFWRRFHLRTPASLLVRELLGRVHDRGPVVNVSDGGHIENTAAIELLRRRCGFIVLVDGEADPERSFGGFANLQRFARLDMAIEIDLDLRDLRPDDKGHSRRLAAAGTIHYPAIPALPATSTTAAREAVPAADGHLLYFKLGVTGSERATAAEYRQKNKDFPHQSTGDQAFDEAQFEAYRELGFAAGQEVFPAQEEVAGLTQFAAFAKWFQGLEGALAPSGAAETERVS